MHKFAFTINNVWINLLCLLQTEKDLSIVVDSEILDQLTNLGRDVDSETP